MKMAEALAAIREGQKGYIVHFATVVESKVLMSDYFPDIAAGEEPIATEEEAWRLAWDFAAAVDCVNVFVCNNKFRPVPCHETRMLKRWRA